jgi:TonB-dependent receptor
MATANAAYAQDAANEDEVIATGIRQSLENALQLERTADSLTEVILAEDIGKLPDQNLAEVLENITGIQITRTAGVGTGVQIRGTNANRVEFNGVSTVGSGSGRSGIDFEDVNPAIIAGVEVIKAPEASTIEGSVGGTINLRTIRPLDLDDTLAAVRLQFEDSNLSTEGLKPRLSGAFGKNFEQADGTGIGFVVSGSYTEQESVSFRPRADRDRLDVRPDDNPSQFLGIQFLLQEQENFDYETINLAGTLEAKPTDRVRLYLDAIYNDQERAQDSYRIQASGVSSLRSFATPTSFEAVDFGVGIGSVQAALTGFLEPDLDVDDDDPNLRFSSDTGARITESLVLALGGEFEVTDRLTARAEYANTSSDTFNPNLSTTLNFINPNCPLNGPATGDTSTSNDNCVPYVYDLSNESLSFGINFNSPFAPTVDQLLDPANVVLDQVDVSRNSTDNGEEALRFDLSYDLEGTGFGDFVKSVDVGYRYNNSSSEFERINDRIGGFSRLVDSPRGTAFADLLVPGPSNFGDADGRELFVANFLLVDPDRAFSDPDGVLSTLEAAIAAEQADLCSRCDSEAVLTVDTGASYLVEETTDAFYAQANFDFGMVRGNAGFRYLDTTVESTVFVPGAAGAGSQQTTTGEYDFFLPRFNLIATPHEDLVLRAGYGSDIRRPDFSDINTATSFTQNENTTVSIGNPGLVPEEVDSFDISADWYFSPASVLSIGYFNKKRTNIFGQFNDGALLSPGASDSGLVRETNPACPGGGVFNPIVIPNQFGDPNTTGLCVDAETFANDSDTTTQEGIEIALQYDLSGWEDRMGGFGWASGFGFLANYTHQTFSGGSVVDTTSGRGLSVLGDVTIPRGLLDFSNNAYNLTAFYEKYGLSARVRYTWREAFRTNDFGGGASTNSTFSFPVITEDRGQLNGSVTYDVTDNLSVGVEAVNLTKSNIVQRCVSATGPLCFVGYPDRRVVFGASYRF